MALVRDRAIYWLSAKVRKTSRKIAEDEKAYKEMNVYPNYKTFEELDRAKSRLEMYRFLLDETKKNRPD